MRYTPNGNPVTSFTVATNRRYKTADGEDKDETEWFRVSAWNRLAENTNQFLQRGSKVYVEGRLSSRTYVSNDGETRVSLDVNATEVRFLDSRNSASTSSPTSSPTSSTPSQDSNEKPSSSSEDSENFDELPW